MVKLNEIKRKNRTVGALIKRPNGITLISLVITIVVLVILSAVAIYLALGNNGILNKAEQAKNETIKQTATEKMNLKITNMQIEKYAEEQRMPTLQEFADGLCEDDEIQYVQLQSKKVGSLDKVEVGNASSIFTKLKEYPYEFEINSSLQLASIDGIKMAASTNTTKFKSLINKLDGIYNSEDGGYIFKTTTSPTTISTNNSITLNETIENYDILLFETDVGAKSNYRYVNTTLAITNGLLEYNSSSNPFVIVNNYGDCWNRIYLYFNNNTNFMVYHSQASASWDTEFRIKNIYGIKF